MKRIIQLMFIVLFITACSAQPTEGAPAVEPPITTPVSDAATSTPASVETTDPPEIKAPVVEAPSIIFIDMLNETDGWAFTTTQIIRTNDGGTTWHDMTPPGLSDVGVMGRITLLDADHAWVQVPNSNNIPNGGSLYRTQDGGITWSFNSTPFSGGQLAFVDANNGWMLADLGIGAGSNAVAIYQTTDGGASWTQTFTNDPNDPNSNEGIPLGGLKSMLVPRDMQTAWVGGVVYAPSIVYLYRTDDGGRTWKQIDLPLPEDVGMSEITADTMRFFGDEGLLALRLAGETYRTAFYVTHDAGETWMLTSTILPGSGTTEILSAEEIVFYNGQQFYVTRDAAKTWSVAEPDVAFGDFFAYMSFVNASTGWVIKSDVSDHRSLYKTTDGGKTWLALIP